LLVAVEELSWPTAVFFTVELAFPATGFLIVLRTGNRVGWVFLHSGEIARLQIKWFLYAAATFLAAQLVFNVFELGRDNGLLAIVGGLSTLPIPAAVAVAVLKHRLYDIDFIINRTLLWTCLTATLSGVYLFAVTVLQGALHPLAGDSAPSVAVSTLTVAALFRPAHTFRRLSIAVSTAADMTRARP
jgi:hypothetical protein